MGGLQNLLGAQLPATVSELGHRSQLTQTRVLWPLCVRHQELAFTTKAAPSGYFHSSPARERTERHMHTQTVRDREEQRNRARHTETETWADGFDMRSPLPCPSHTEPHNWSHCPTSPGSGWQRLSHRASCEGVWESKTLTYSACVEGVFASH